jgi:hypothetical protein
LFPERWVLMTLAKRAVMVSAMIALAFSGGIIGLLAIIYGDLFRPVWYVMTGAPAALLPLMAAWCGPVERRAKARALVAWWTVGVAYALGAGLVTPRSDVMVYPTVHGTVLHLLLEIPVLVLFIYMAWEWGTWGLECVLEQWRGLVGGRSVEGEWPTGGLLRAILVAAAVIHWAGWSGSMSDIALLLWRIPNGPSV